MGIGFKVGQFLWNCCIRVRCIRSSPSLHSSLAVWRSPCGQVPVQLEWLMSQDLGTRLLERLLVEWQRLSSSSSFPLCYCSPCTVLRRKEVCTPIFVSASLSWSCSPIQ